MDIKTYIESGILENYVLGTASQEENSILECVMKNNEEVKTALFEMQETLEKLAYTNAIGAPEELKSQIFSKLDFEEKSSQNISNLEKKGTSYIPLEIGKGNIEITEKKSNISTWLAAASLLLLMAFGWTMFKNQEVEKALVATKSENAQNEKQVQFLANQNKILLNADRIQLNGVEKHPGMLANVYWDKKEMVYLSVENLPAAPQGKEYQLWAIVDGKPVDVGMYKAGSEMQEMKKIKSAQAFAITLENEGGVATPTMEEMYVMGEVS